MQVSKSTNNFSSIEECHVIRKNSFAAQALEKLPSHYELRKEVEAGGTLETGVQSRHEGGVYQLKNGLFVANVLYLLEAQDHGFLHDLQGEYLAR